MWLIDKLSHQNKWININPLFKFFVYITLLITIGLAGSAFKLIMLSAIIALTRYSTGISWKNYLKISSVPYAFLLMSVIAIVISFSTNGSNMLYKIHLHSIYIGFEKKILIDAMHIFTRSITMIAATYFFILTTPFNQIIIILKKLRIPDVLIENMLLTYHFIFILLAETLAIYRAQELRFGYINMRTCFTSLAMLIGLLFLRVILRYQRMQLALEVKLYDGKFH